MLALLGSSGLVVALAGAGLLVSRGVGAAKGKSRDLTRPVSLLVAGSAASMTAMVIALLSDDFSLAYVANHHASATPFPFDVATAWAALEGSILLWGLVLSGFTWFMVRRYEHSPDPLGAAALAVMGAVALFFFGLMVTVANPFEVCTGALPSGCATQSPWPFSTITAPLDGPGPNPLLQNHVLMAVHPPMLYLGYVGLTVPFAYAIGALALKTPGPEWLRRSHRATLVAWSFLTLGIALGGWWAYEVLSWGGYWAWDPVENASLMPWLVATAFLHSAVVQQRRGTLQAWNFILVIAAFSLTIFGTFLTRSGTINSVHSFTQSAIGPALLGFLVVVLTGSFMLFSARAHIVASPTRISHIVSREGTFLLNNLLLSVYAFVVIVGTTYPLFLEAFTGTQVGVGEPFFNRLAVPLSFALLLVMGFGPVTPWQGASGEMLWARTRLPALAALSAGALTAVFVTRIGWVVLAVMLGTFVVGSIVGLLTEQARRRSVARRIGKAAATLEVIKGDVPFWSGQLSHVGVVMIALGIAFAANMGTHLEADVSPGDTVVFAGFEITYESPFQRSTISKTTRGARMSVFEEGRLVAVLEPAANFFGSDTSGISTPDVLTRPSGDLYLTLLSLDAETATVAFDTSPLIWLLWLGGATTAAGGFWTVSDRRRAAHAAEARQTANA